MAEITAALVKSFREKTGLPMMECKKALTEANGDEDAAMKILREKGKIKLQEKGAERTTEEGAIVVFSSDKGTAMVELLCESAPVAGHEEFLQLATNIAEAYLNNGGETVEEVMKLASPSKPGMSLQDQLDELYNRIREVFRVSRFVRVLGNAAYYVHHNRKVGVLVETEGSNPEAAKDICMHVAAMHPEVLDRSQISDERIASEREIMQKALENDPKNANKPANILEKIIDGQINAFFKQICLVDQEFVKEPKLSVGQFAQQNGISLKNYIYWVLGKK